MSARETDQSTQGTSQDQRPLFLNGQPADFPTQIGWLSVAGNGNPSSPAHHSVTRWKNGRIRHRVTSILPRAITTTAIFQHSPNHTMASEAVLPSRDLQYRHAMENRTNLPSRDLRCRHAMAKHANLPSRDLLHPGKATRQAAYVYNGRSPSGYRIRPRPFEATSLPATDISSTEKFTVS